MVAGTATRIASEIPANTGFSSDTQKELLMQLLTDFGPALFTYYKKPDAWPGQ
jgi:hypothetical protein